MDENKKEKIIFSFLIFSQIFFLLFIWKEIKNDFQQNQKIYSIEEINKKIEKNLKEIEEEKEAILLKENIKKKENKPFLTVYYKEDEVIKNLKKEFEKYKKERIKNLREKKEIDSQILKLKIPSIDLNIDSIPLKEGGEEEIYNNLKKGVIRYWENDLLDYGVTLIYGHSSQPYGTRVDYSYFKKLPLIQKNEKFLLEGKNKNFSYIVLESKEIELNKLEEEIKKYNELGLKQDENYIILITCYPINTTKKRWIVIAKKEKNDINKVLP